MFTRKWWFLLDDDDGAGKGGGEPSDDDDKDGDKKGEDDTSFLDLEGDKKDEKISDDSDTGLMASRKDAKKKKAADSDDDDTSTGERPKNVPEKFWDEKKKELRLETFIESYKERESALSRLRSERNVPEFVEEYLDTFTFDTTGHLRYSEGIDRLPAITKDDPLFVGFLESCHRRGVPTDMAAGLIKDVFKVMDGIYPEPFDDDAFVAEQNEILGKNFEMQTDTAIAWVESLHTQGVLSLNEAKALHRDVGHSAHGVMALNKLRAEMTGEAVIPVHEVVPEDGLPTPEELYSMKLTDKYSTDPEYKKKVDDLFPKVFPGVGNINTKGLGIAAIQANDARRRLKNLKS